jgi:hypothetical protein
MTKAALEKDTDPGLETAMRLIASKRISRN